jgi:hypothetical protein
MVSVTGTNSPDLNLHLSQASSTNIGRQQEIKLPGFDRPSTMACLKMWLEGCAGHTKCLYNATPRLPRRVLDIGDDGEAHVKLLEPEGLRAQYVILSYCWGGPQTTVTDKSTISTHFQGFSIKSLSQTIQDAITVARGLGFRYLWVDALCIVQNDSVDKTLEIAKLHDYFKKASLTIAAGNAQSASDGFLRPSVMPSCVVPYSTPEGIEAKANISHSFEDPEESSNWPEGTISDRNLRGYHQIPAAFRSPIFNRAWTCEENLLSRRKLRYGAQQIFWTCQSSRFYYSQAIVNNSIVDKNIEVFQDPNPNLENFDFFAKNYKPSLATVVRSWDSIVANYTSRHLTQPEDKLPAIGAIAHEFQFVTGDKYLAGLWLRTLPLDLVWYLDRVGRQTYEPAFAASPLYRAPSWSWASVEGRICVERPSRLFTSEIELRSFKIDPKSPEAPFGQVRTGYLEILGRLKQVLALESEEGVESDPFRYDEEIDFESAAEFSLEPPWYLWLFTTYPEETDNSPLEGSPEKKALGLILRPVAGLNEYRRIGVFYAAPPSLFAGTVKSRIRLI